MTLDYLELINFRLHKNTKLKFSDTLNYIIGGNGQGKTTILEAIYYLCTTKSLNQSPDSEAVNFEESYFDIAGQFINRSKDIIKINYSKDTNKKSVLLDNKSIYKASTLIGRFPVVTLTQADHAVTLGAPSDRRKFVDSIISQSSSTYLEILLEYNRIVRQRSSLLSQIKEHRDKELIRQLQAWTETMVEVGSELIKHRLHFISEFNQYLNSSYKKIMDEVEKPGIEYFPLGKIVNDPETVKKIFLQSLKDVENDERIRGMNLTGPHRDDFIFEINKLNLKQYGSQGQHKTFQVALRFAQFFFMEETMGRKPVFLMDDVYGELDADRANKISLYLREVGQTFITLTDLSNINSFERSDNDKKIAIRQGQVINA